MGRVVDKVSSPRLQPLSLHFTLVLLSDTVSSGTQKEKLPTSYKIIKSLESQDFYQVLICEDSSFITEKSRRCV